MKITIVTTTINIPFFLSAYEKNARQFGHEIDFVVAGDLKTPSEAGPFCDRIERCKFLDASAQNKYMKKFPELAAHLPYNSAERRNVAMLMAYEQGADIIVTLDDDNFATSQDMIGLHAIVGTKQMLPTYGSNTGWFNVCSFLEERNNESFYHRGYPNAQRWSDGFISSQQTEHRVIVNAGFWLDNPDVDAITRLERELVVTGYKPGWSGTIALAPGTWTPFNCQNTAISREAIPAYFLSPRIGRHADILASFIINRLAEHFGDVIAFGDPLTIHQRGPRNLWKDFDAERQGILMADGFCEILRNTLISARSYHEGFGQIIESLKGQAQLDNIVAGMELWHEAFKTLGAE